MDGEATAEVVHLIRKVMDDSEATVSSSQVLKEMSKEYGTLLLPEWA